MKLKKRLVVLLASLLFISLANNLAVAQVEFSDELYEELSGVENEQPEIDFPDYQRLELDNGLVVYLVPDDKLPLIEVTGYLKGGRAQENEELAGISDFMLEMMTTGTQNFSESELIRYQELKGINFNLSVKNDYYHLSADALSSEQEELIEILAEVLQRPNFSGDYYNRIRQEISQRLQQAKMQQDSLLDMYFYKQVYDGHPYSFATDLDLRLDALENITPQALESFYEQIIVPEETVLGIVGDFDPEQIKEAIKDEFGNWEGTPGDFELEKVSRYNNEQPEIIIIDQPNATQAKLRLGYPFYGHDFEEQTAFQMANRVFGGGSFGTRLMENLRSEKGYVYGVYAVDNYYQLGGDYYIQTEVEPEKALEVKQAIQEEKISLVQGEDKITGEELFEVINRYNALFPRSYDCNRCLLGEMIYNVELRDRSFDYTNQFIAEYNNLTVEKVQNSFAEHANPEVLLTVIVGNKEDIVPQFEEANKDFKVIETR